MLPEASCPMFLLDPSVTFLNHGSFGAMPASVRDVQRAFQDHMEREPVDFLARKLPDLLAVARASAAGLIGARPDDVVFVPNATTGINAVVDAVPLETGDEILTTTHRYDAVGHTLQRRALQRGATVVEASFPYTGITTDRIVDAITSAMSPRTRLLVIDAITSPTALVLPLEPIIAAAQHRGIPVLVDGAHAPGHIPVDVSTLGADWWVGNLHKWVCAPKGSAVLWARHDHHATLWSPITSHGWRGGLHEEFDWPGTHDPSARLASAAAIDWWRENGGETLGRNHTTLARDVRARFAEASGLVLPPPPAPELQAGMHTMRLPGVAGAQAEAFCNALFAEHRVEVPVFRWDDQAWLRYSAFSLYNTPEQYTRLGHAVRDLLPRFQT